MAWEVSSRSSVPNTDSTRTAQLRGPNGYCILTGWLQGCGLNALERLSSLGSCTAAEWPEFRDTLKSLGTRLEEGGGNYNPLRWMFTITDTQLRYNGEERLVGQMVKESRLVDSFKNWSHGSETIHMYFLEFK